MLILVWFVVCILFYFVELLLGNSDHALEVFAVLSGIAIFLISLLSISIKTSLRPFLDIIPSLELIS